MEYQIHHNTLIPNKLQLALAQNAPRLKSHKFKMHTRTFLMVSFTAGTGSRGRDVWKLYVSGLRPEKIFTINCEEE